MSLTRAVLIFLAFAWVKDAFEVVIESSLGAVVERVLSREFA